MQNPDVALISQYANSPTITTLIDSFNQSIDPASDIDNIYSYIWDISTAVGFGLDIWGKIVGVSRLLQVPASTQYFGFSEGETQAEDYGPFGQSPFYESVQTGSYELSDDAFRVLILVKALANIANASMATYNKLMLSLFAGRGRCYALDQGSMQIQFTFEFYMYPYELAILQQSGALPRPTGVELSLLQVDVAGTFGFSEAGDFQPFGSGTFSLGVLSVN